ncbi:hypothetical protein [Georgenia sp. SYP-B2076]|uniref:hypothetical protein n=1 Tax=Georgenia sp. SYP-B2076 TaxID=2495881 RepID=UPI000F8EFB1F|nr:hypothetical protein [Georgenia sp. SYP-B2076]
MRIAVLRPEDLLTLELELVNLAPSPDGTTLEREDPAQDAIVVVRLPPQALAEGVFDDPTALPWPPVPTALSGPTRLVFRVPAGSVPLTPDGLLGWDAWEPLLAPTALPRGTAPAPGIPAPAEPGPLETAIEFPYRLLLSPDPTGRWRTDNGAGSAGHAQLWSAVLVAGPGDGGRPGADVRALAQRGGPGTADTVPGALSPTVREQIVRLSSDFGLPVGEPPAPGAQPPAFTPVPIRADRLELTALGANAELDAQWDYPEPAPPPAGYVPLSLRKYQHTAALGRDHFVRTVIVGFLCGTGHRAVYVETVERLPGGVQTVGQAPGGGALFGAKAYLLRTAQVVVQQPLLDYAPLAPAFAHDGHELPLRSIRLTTLSARVAHVEGYDTRPFWLTQPDGGDYVRFGATATDVAGGTLTFTLPLMFVPFGVLDQHRTIRAVFDHPPFPGPAVIPLAGQALAAAPAAVRAGSTTVRAQSLTYDIEQPYWGGPPSEHVMRVEAAPDGYLPRFLPRMAAVTGSSPAVDDLLGTAAPQVLVPAKEYLDHGFAPGGNRAELFLGLAQPLELGFPAQRGGGLASPSQTVTALSRGLGPVASPDALQAGDVDLGAFADMRLFGTIALTKVLAELPFDGAAATGPLPTDAQLEDQAFTLSPPRLVTTRTPPGAAVPDRVESRFLWKPRLRSESIGPLTLDLDRADLLLDARTAVERGGQVTAGVRGHLRGARLTFAKALSVTLGELTFRQEDGKKTELGARDVDITFEGPLAFVSALQAILPADGFDDPPSVTVDAQGVVAGYTLGVPDVAVGIFSLQNIALSAALSLPFTDRPAGVRFAVSERHSPFLVTVSLFGGGGFFAVGVSANGIEEVEASIEFGGNIALNLGVASGGVSVMAGIYFGLTGPVVTLTGYLRCGGYLEVLGLISVSLEFYLAFTYRKKPAGSEVWGQASLTVSVRVAFFSTSVSLSVERRFAGSDGDPSFADTVTPAEWAGYLQAFA